MRAWLPLLLPDFRPSHYALSATRIAFFSVCLVELCQLYFWRRLCFAEQDVAPILGWPCSVPHIILPIAIAVQICLILGIWTRTSALANLLILHILASSNQVPYHFDAVMVNVAFVFLCMPSPRVWAVDAWMHEKKPGSRDALMVPTWRAFLLFLAVELVYFDSLFFKFQSTVWMDGLAFWMPAALPHFSTGMLPDWAEQPALMKIACYVALATEMLFPLVLYRRFRLLMFSLAFGLHLGIAVFFPIPLFGLGMCALLLFFVDWDAIVLRFASSTGSLPAPVRPQQHKAGDLFGMATATLLVTCQLLLIAQESLVDRLPRMRHATTVNQMVGKLMGLSRHGVYVDEHFAMETPILRWQTRIDGQVVELPTYDERGYPLYPTVSGRFWVLHLWVLRRDCLTVEELQSRWTSYLRGWFAHRGIEPRPVDLLWKPASSPGVMDFELDDRIEQAGWRHGGQIVFGDANTTRRVCLNHDFTAYLRQAMDNRLDARGT